ncbi:MAG: YdeI/OmpD-associated family protein [Rubrivivax sp.]|nr:YdeI/OmpD-associated family protein [Rubrivivax sp.]
MPPTERRVDAYIAAAQPFAQPILARLREDVHAACPEAAEAIKWSMPFFVYGGRNLAHMAAFRAHCAFGFELGRAVVDLGREAQAMGQFGRITKLDDLPSRAELRRLVRKAAALIDAGQRAPRAPKSGSGESTPPAAKRAVHVPPLPAAFAEALAHDAGARRVFDALAPSHRRDYVEWIAEAKRDQTRARRVAQALAWLAEGKRRNGQYERARAAA